MHRGEQFRDARLGVVLLALLGVGCTVYDGALVDGQTRSVSATPSPPQPEAMDAGMDVGVEDAGRAPQAPQAPEVRCGDGRVTGAEKCDVAIEAGAPGACPTTCPELAPCNPRALNNTGCQAECVVLQLVCRSGDGCCPGNCTGQNDKDCSSSCGDGVIESELGETCEPGSATPCKRTDADCDDQDACTADKLVGSPNNCNAQCTHTRLTRPQDGDGCCLPGSNANTDSDCKPACGNGVRETGEACDRTTGCGADCKLTLQPNQILCLDQLGEGADDCAKCSCANCVDSYVPCVAGQDALTSRQCATILECARKKACFGSACYCGDSLLCALPNGPCRAEIEAAAGSADPNVIRTLTADATSVLGKSYAADTCRTQQCATQCR